MNRPQYILSAVFLFLIFSSCGQAPNSLGGTEAGNPDQERIVMGQLQPDNSPATLVKHSLTNSACPADQVIATDSLALTSTADIDTGCSFSLNLRSNKAYVLSFSLDEQFIATLVVNNGPNTEPSNIIVISPDSLPIDLGIITISNTTAYPEYEPAEQNDQDDDGIEDYEDDDDDNDGFYDDEEDDCDLDGYSDDYDEEDCAETEEEEEEEEEEEDE